MDTKELMTNLSLLSPLILATGILIGLSKYRKVDGRHKLMLWYLFTALLTDLDSRYLGLISAKGNNLVLLSVTGLIDLLFIARLYLKYYLPSGRKLLIIPISVVALAVALKLVFYNNSYAANFQSYDKLICNVCIVILCLVCLMDMLKTRKNPKEVMRINAAVLLYFSVDILISMTSNFLINEALNLVIYFWMVRLLLMMYMYFVLIQTLWQTGKNRKHWQFG